MCCFSALAVRLEVTKVHAARGKFSSAREGLNETITLSIDGHHLIQTKFLPTSTSSLKKHIIYFYYMT